MKRLLAVLAISISLISCGSGNSDTNSGSGNMNAGSAPAGDSLQRASDSVMQTGDTSALNQPLGDSASPSGSHGQGSVSRVGGGNTGGPQDKKGEKANP